MLQLSSLKILSFLSIIFFISNLSLADTHSGSWSSNRPDSHAPIGVMGEHIHSKGEYMLSYRYMNMEMDGNLDGSSSISTEEILEDFMVTPTDMRMEMHMLGGMYAPNDNLTLTAMVPFIEKSMNHQTRNNMNFETKSSGIGDIVLGGLFGISSIAGRPLKNQLIIMNGAVSIPTGDISERGDTPAMAQAPLPYPMQLGSGTLDLKPGMTYLGQHESLSWGAQGIGTLRLGRNTRDYSLGERFDSSAWLSYAFNNFISTSFRTTWSIWGNIDGADPRLNPNMVPTANPDLRGGRRVDLGFGLNLLLSDTEIEILKSLRLAGEFLVPVYQNLDGPQLETDWSFVLGLQKSFS